MCTCIFQITMINISKDAVDGWYHLLVNWLCSFIFQ